MPHTIHESAATATAVRSQSPIDDLSGKDMRTETEHTIFLKDYAPSPYRILSVDLDFAITADLTRVVAQLTVEPLEQHRAGHAAGT